MTTVREIITDALLELGVTDLVDAVDAPKAQFGMRVLNRMLESWNTEDLMTYTVNRVEYPLTATKGEYTIGVGGDFDVSRPVRIERMSLMNYNNPTLPLEIPMDLVTDDEWQGVAVKGTTSAFPTKAWITGNFPLNSIFVWPIPNNSTHKLVLYSWSKTEPFTSLDTAISFPNGYTEAIVTNLALNLSSSFGVQPMPSLIQRAISSKSKVASINKAPLYASTSDRGNSPGVRSFGRLVDRV